MLTFMFMNTDWSRDSTPISSCSCRSTKRQLSNNGQKLVSLIDLPPLKWSFLKYVFRMEDKIDGKEEAYG